MINSAAPRLSGTDERPAAVGWIVGGVVLLGIVAGVYNGAAPRGSRTPTLATVPPPAVAVAPSAAASSYPAAPPSAAGNGAAGNGAAGNRAAGNRAAGPGRDSSGGGNGGDSVSGPPVDSSPPQASVGGGFASASVPFEEHPARAEIPTISATNESYQVANLSLTDRYGRTYTLQTPPMQTTSISVPAGTYRVSIMSDNADVHPNYGDAVFRPFKSYTATWVLAPETESTPIHLGD